MTKNFKIILATALLFTAFIGGYLFSRFELWIDLPIFLSAFKIKHHKDQPPPENNATKTEAAGKTPPAK